MFCLPSHSDLCFILLCDGNEPIYLAQSWSVLKLELYNHLYVVLFLFSKNYKKVKRTLLFSYFHLTFMTLFSGKFKLHFVFVPPFCIGCLEMVHLMLLF